MRLIFINFLLFFSAFGQNLDFNTIKSNFIQTIISPEGSKLKYEGNFYAKKPNLALWNYTKPMEKSIYYLKENVIIVEPELEQAIMSKIKNIPDIPSLLKKAKKDKDGNFYTMFDDTKFTIKLKNKTLDQIEYKDKLDNSVNITFINPHVDVNIDNNIFKYTIPNGYDIIRN